VSVYVVEELVRRDHWLDSKETVLQSMRDKVAAKMMHVGVLAPLEAMEHAAEVYTVSFCKMGNGNRFYAQTVERATHVHLRMEIMMGEGG
jgi:hypothetical protein